MSQAQSYMELMKAHGAKHYLPLPVVLTEGEGSWVTDVDGKRYLDMMSAYSALNHGHRHPRILAAIQKQLGRLTLTSRAFHNDQLGPFLKELTTLAEMDRALTMNTGAEAVETALKIARKWGYRAKNIPQNQARIIACRNNFHGRTISIVSFSSEELYRGDFGPHTPGFDLIDYGSLEALEAAITPETAAFLVEPIQGEAGILVPPEGYLKGVREICDRHNILMMCDEIQTGLGRTGKLFCTQHEEVKPDVLILGKALGGGFFPISSVLTREDVLTLFETGEHGSTFGGNPLAVSAAREALRVLVDEDLCQKAAEQGKFFMERLRALKSPIIKEVRGKGLLIGVELNDESGARPYCEALMDRGVLCKETHETVVRFAPPLNVERKDLEWALEHIEAVLCPSSEQSTSAESSKSFGSSVSNEASL